MSNWKPDIFEYVDFRKYLKDYYDAAKKNMSVFSYRYFAKKAGYKSSNFLHLVITGKRRLGEESIPGFAKALGLSAGETTFFRDLVHFDQAKDDETRNNAFARISSRRRFKAARHLDANFFRYTARWYYPAIREMAAREDFREDPEWIAAQLFPPISPAEVTEALQTLLELELLERDGDGRLSRGAPSLTTGYSVPAWMVANIHKQMLERARESIDEIPGDRRELGALTVCVAPERIEQIKQEIRQTRKRLLDLCDRDDNPRVVYQINFQAFPLTRFDDEVDS